MISDSLASSLGMFSGLLCFLYPYPFFSPGQVLEVPCGLISNQKICWLLPFLPLGGS